MSLGEFWVGESLIGVSGDIIGDVDCWKICRTRSDFKCEVIHWISQGSRIIIYYLPGN